MKSLEKWQIISFISRMTAMAVGIIQSFIILRILSVGEWGIVQLVVSIGSSLGIYQHLGLASASNREIAASENKCSVFKIFFTSFSVRYVVTTPISLGLYFLAPRIAVLYGFPEITFPLKLFAVIIFFQGIQAVINAVISGTKRFKELFILQIIIAAASLIIYVPLVYLYKINGFFYANLLHEGLKSFLYLFIGLRPLKGNFRLPSKMEYLGIVKSLFSLGMGIYLVKIVVMNWEKSGTNLLGFLGSAEMLGLFAFAMLYAKKLMNISDSITDVSLPIFSEMYVKDVVDFKMSFTKNFDRIYFVVLFFAISSIYWVREIVIIFVGDNKYDGSMGIILPMVFSYLFYSLMDIIKSSLIIPAKLVKEMIFGYVFMLVFTVGCYFLGRNVFPPVFSMSYAMLIGVIVGLGILVLMAQRKLGFIFFNHSHTLIIIQAFAISYMGGLTNLFIKIPAYFILIIMYIWALLISGLLTKKEISTIINRLWTKISGRF